MAGRRTSLASLAGSKVENVPGQSDPLLLALPLDKVVPTRFNPRRRFGTEDELREFGQKLAKKQLQPAVVVSRTAYLKLWPEEAEHVGNTPYVIANGERRYRASLLVGRPTLDVVHNEDVANSRAEFLDAVQSENNDRENLDPIERALGIDIMVTQIGGSAQVAAYYGKTKGWVSQQRKLLKLTPELQDLVSSGEMPVRVARDIAGLPPLEQAQAWKAEVAAREAAKAMPRAARATVKSQEKEEPPREEPAESTATPDRFTAVNSSGAAELTAVTSMGAQPPAVAETADTDVGGEPRADQAATNPQTPSQGSVRGPEPNTDPVPVPEPRINGTQSDTDIAGERRQVKMPWHDGVACAEIAIRKMTPDQRDRMAERLLEQKLAEQEERSAPARIG